MSQIVSSRECEKKTEVPSDIHSTMVRPVLLLRIGKAEALTTNTVPVRCFSQSAANPSMCLKAYVRDTFFYYMAQIALSRVQKLNSVWYFIVKIDYWEDHTYSHSEL